MVGVINFIKSMFWGRNVSMKLWKYGIVCAALCMLICASFTVSGSGFSDPTGDVSYGTVSAYFYDVDNRPNVDITQLSVVVKGNSVTLNLTVAGGIQISDDVKYYAYVNSTDTHYGMTLNNAQIIGWSMNRDSEVFEYANRSVIAAGDTLSVILNLRGNTSMVTIYGFAMERTLNQSGQPEYIWFDNAMYELTTMTNNTSGNNTIDNAGASSGHKTPGFELLPVIAAVTITTILFRRRR
jgi:hypothetical protein